MQQTERMLLIAPPNSNNNYTSYTFPLFFRACFKQTSVLDTSDVDFGWKIMLFRYRSEFCGKQQQKRREQTVFASSSTGYKCRGLQVLRLIVISNSITCAGSTEFLALLIKSKIKEFFLATHLVIAKKPSILLFPNKLCIVNSVL